VNSASSQVLFTLPKIRGIESVIPVKIPSR